MLLENEIFQNYFHEDGHCIFGIILIDTLHKFTICIPETGIQRKTNFFKAHEFIRPK